MKLNAKLDVDVVALQQDDEVTCLLTFDAPIPVDLGDRPGETLVLVVDRSGSMKGAPLEAVRSSLHSLVDRMKSQDSFGVVVFDHQAEIAVPTRPIRDHHLPTVHGLIDALHPGGTTDLSAGYLLGLAEARRHRTATGATVLLLSDGHANQGLVDPLQLGQLAAQAGVEQITTATVGLGTGYDEVILAEVATQGNGTHRFAFTPDDATAVVAEEAGDLLSKSIVNAFVRIRPSDPALLERIATLHDLPRWVEADPDGQKVIVIPLGDLFAGETRELLVHFDVPAIAGLGHHTLATFTIDYVALPELKAQTISWPVAVNVIPGDQARHRVPDPSVTTARLLAESTKAKKRASEALERGDAQGAGLIMDERVDLLQSALAGINPELPDAEQICARLAEEAEQLRKLARGARDQDAMLAQKSFMEDINMESRGRNDQLRRDRTRGKRDF